MSALEQNLSDSNDSDDENRPFGARGRGLFGKFTEFSKRPVGAIELSETRRHSRDSTRWFQPEVDRWRQQTPNNKRILFVVEMKPTDSFFDGTIIQRLCPQLFCIGMVFPMGHDFLFGHEYYRVVLFEDDDCSDQVIWLDNPDDVVATWRCHLSWTRRLTPIVSIAIPLRIGWISALVNCAQRMSFGVERHDQMADSLFDTSVMRGHDWHTVKPVFHFTTKENYLLILEGPAKARNEITQLIRVGLAAQRYEHSIDIKISSLDCTFNNDFLRPPSHVAVPTQDSHRRWPALLRRTIDLCLLFGPSLKETLPPYVFEQVLFYEPHFLLHKHGKRIQAIIQIYESIRAVLASRRIAK